MHTANKPQLYNVLVYMQVQNNSVKILKGDVFFLVNN